MFKQHRPDFDDDDECVVVYTTVLCRVWMCLKEYIQSACEVSMRCK